MYKTSVHILNFIIRLMYIILPQLWHAAVHHVTSACSNLQLSWLIIDLSYKGFIYGQKNKRKTIKVIILIILKNLSEKPYKSGCIFRRLYLYIPCLMLISWFVQDSVIQKVFANTHVYASFFLTDSGKEACPASLNTIVPRAGHQTLTKDYHKFPPRKWSVDTACSESSVLSSDPGIAKLNPFTRLNSHWLLVIN